jgi:amino acid adenylation domain-containing protein
VGSPIANRNRAEIEGLIGFFVNTLVLRTNLAGNPSFEELLKRVRQVSLGAYAHQDLPFELLVEQLQPQRDLSHTPLFQVMFVLQNAPMSALELPGLTLTALESDSGSAQFDLTLSITETESGLVASFEYNTDLFEESSIQRMAGHLQTLLEGIVANPQQRLSELPLLTKSEQHQLLREWNGTEVEYPHNQCIHELFEAQVEKTPDAVAVVFENQQLTYRELNQRANQLAHYLQNLGVKPEVLVGICVERSLDMVVGLLAIFKAGGAYVPLDPAYPQERIALMLNDAQVPVLLTQQHLLGQLPAHTAKVVCLDNDVNWQAVSSAIKQNPLNQTNPANLAYVIYTSGSTGTPKGVTIQHQSLVNFVQATIKEYELQAQDRILQFASISFDVAVEEIFSCLLSGATLVLRTDEMLASIPAFLEKCLILCISVLDIPTSFWHQLTSELSTSKLTLPETLRLVVTGSEKALADTVHTWRKQVEPRLRLVNAYGPTETTVGATVCDLAGTKELIAVEPEVPIGRAIANVQTYVLDSDLQPVPIGVWGELYIGGVGVARGYLHQPELTAHSFIPNPFSNEPGSRLYKTGDRVRYRSDGQIEFNGRIDNQVKIRGFRIELGEIEAVLSQHPDVRSTVVIARQDYSNDKRLVAYIVPELDKQQTTKNLNQHLRDYLSKSLPNYMLPSAFVILDKLPLTPNGKVDRKALPMPDTVRPELELVYQPPQTEIEKTIADIWQEVLHVENVGIYDNFFELGGHSLLLVQVHSKLQKIFQKDLLLVEMFQHPTVSHLARYFSQESREETSFIQHSHRSESRKTSTQRRKQARKEHRAATKERGVSSQSDE